MKYIVPIQNYWTVHRGYRFGVKAENTPHHLGVDLGVKIGIPIVAPCDGFSSFHWGPEGGYQTYLETDTLHFRWLHESAFGKKGWVKQGDIIGYSGNTGFVLPKPDAAHPHAGEHIHHDIADLTKGSFDINHFERFIDPDLFYKQKRFMQGEGSDFIYIIVDGVRHIVTPPVDSDEIELVPMNVIQSFPEGEPYFI